MRNPITSGCGRFLVVAKPDSINQGQVLAHQQLVACEIVVQINDDTISEHLIVHLFQLLRAVLRTALARMSNRLPVTRRHTPEVAPLELSRKSQRTDLAAVGDCKKSNRSSTGLPCLQMSPFSYLMKPPGETSWIFSLFFLYLY